MLCVPAHQWTWSQSKAFVQSVRISTLLLLLLLRTHPRMDMLWHVLVITTCISLPISHSHHCHLLGRILPPRSSLHFLVCCLCHHFLFICMHLHSPHHTKDMFETRTTISRGTTATHTSLIYGQDKHSGPTAILAPPVRLHIRYEFTKQR
jgi:hypothetical protein